MFKKRSLISAVMILSASSAFARHEGANLRPIAADNCRLAFSGDFEIFLNTSLVAKLQQLGYELGDSLDNPALSAHVEFDSSSSWQGYRKTVMGHLDIKNNDTTLLYSKTALFNRLTLNTRSFEDQDLSVKQALLEGVGARVLAGLPPCVAKNASVSNEMLSGRPMDDSSASPHPWEGEISTTTLSEAQAPATPMAETTSVEPNTTAMAMEVSTTTLSEPVEPSVSTASEPSTPAMPMEPSVSTASEPSTPAMPMEPSVSTASEPSTPAMPMEPSVSTASEPSTPAVPQEPSVTSASEPSAAPQEPLVSVASISVTTPCDTEASSDELAPPAQVPSEPAADEDSCTSVSSAD